jgi:hypothetical protein
MSATALYRFSADVNGVRRSCTVRLYKGQTSPEDAELVMENDEPAYTTFYNGASPADYEAPLTNMRVRPFR